MFFKILKTKKQPSKTNQGFTPTPIPFARMKTTGWHNSNHLRGEENASKKIGVSSQRERGFTLIELLVVFFIMATILAVIVPDYLSYSTKADLDNLTLDVALTIREAQSYGAGVKVNAAGNFDTAYGVHFSLNNSNQFIFFEDTNGNELYTPSIDTIINTYTMKSGYTINDLCTQGAGSSNVRCKANNVNYIDIVFRRPNPEATISRNNIFLGDDGSQDDAWIKLASPDGGISSVHATSMGRISVE